MQTTKITSRSRNFAHANSTIQENIQYLIDQFGPQDDPVNPETITIHEVTELDDYHNEYAFLIIFPNDPDSDLTEEIPAYLEDMPYQRTAHLNDFCLLCHYDYTINHHFVFLTYSK